jgi:hypothetical protein
MTEKLKGQYTYGEPYPDSIKGKSMRFEIEWKIIDGIIKGICVDDEGKEIFEAPATISGFVDNGVISFLKKYPKYWDIDDKGIVRLLDRPPAPEIHYSGVFVNII